MNKFTQLLKDRPLELFKKFSVAPPNGVSQGNRDGKLLFERAFSAPQNVGPNDYFKGFQHGEVKDDRRIAWITLEQAVAGKHEAPSGSLVFQAYKDADPNGDSIPVYFLPWESKCLISMTIPEKDRKRDDPNDPMIFFTAAINGCSVFVRGNPKQPEIFHAGISQGQTPTGNNPALFWRQLMGEHVTRSRKSGILSEVNNTDYINQTGVSGRAWTANSDKVQKWINTFPLNKMEVREVTPWGCVFGIRYGSLWSFYLQENAKVTTYRIEKQTVTRQVEHKVKRNKLSRLVSGDTFKIISETVSETVTASITVRSESFPMLVRSFYPGHGKVEIKTPEFQVINSGA